ncbi:Transcription initiation factor IIE, alpha subunit [Pseudoloma neurophilia]|uniref:Transcription initiation factor IIE, alpha subunit n=1 Tax=Pseudoloma neurophilia TaxID=146866 RepID=A0A0R0LSF7_9MICR|nr:Transcription initiation factor IIE, alpha subunit [Pseudoloma neurophilia]
MSNDYIPLMQSLIRNVLRKFYEPHHCVIMDILLEHLLLKENEICSHMHMLGKEFNRLIIKLREDKFIRQESKIETTPDGRQLLQQCYFLDFREIKDIIKYKIYKMGKIISKRENQNLSDIEIEFKCLECENIFSILEVQSFMKDFKFFCPDCDLILKETKTENSFELHTLMMKDLKEIIEMLKQADKFDIPTMDYFQVLDLKKKNEQKKEEKTIEIKTPIIEIEIKEESLSQNILTESFPEDNITFSDKEIEIEPKKINKKEEPLISVNGEMKKLSEITTDDQEKMTEDEYEEYFRILEEE